MPKASKNSKRPLAEGTQIPPATPRTDRLEEVYRKTDSANDANGAVQRFRICQIEALLAILGSDQTAKVLRLLTVDMSQVDGDEAMQKRLIDVTHVVGRAITVMHCDDIFAWLTTPEVLLRNRIPLNVLRTPSGLLDVEASLEGIYAGTSV